jgi:2-iminobutanoate/2-iminopropanoate deaminase
MPTMNKTLILVAAMACVWAATSAEAQTETPAKRPVMPFSPAVQIDNVLYLSGAIGLKPDGTLDEGLPAQARQTMDNIGIVLGRYGRGYDDVFKCTVMLKDMSQWDAFNQIYVGYFKPEHLPARSAFGSTALAKGAEVEVECMAYAPPKVKPQ